MKVKLGKAASLNHYRFRDQSEIQLGFNFTKEDFLPYHPHRVYDISVNYGRGCVFVEWRRKHK
jgi:hypothetical protein